MQDTYTTPTPVAPQGKSNTTLVIVALSLGLLVALISALYTTNIRRQIASQMKSVWYLRRDMSPGDRFNPDRDVREGQLPATALDQIPGVIKELSLLKNQEGQEFRRSAGEGMMVSMTMFQGDDELKVSQIAPGNVACALNINGRTAPAGLRPGMFVDIVVTVSPPGQLPETYRAMEKVKVIGVGSQTDESGGSVRSYSSITVEVKPHEALALVAIANSTQVSSKGFSLLIRNPSDTPTSLGVNRKVLDDLRIEPPKPTGGS